jgi:hypothetical protein
LFQVAATDAESFNSVLAGPMAILKTCGNVYFEVGPDNGAKDQALPSRSLKTCFGLEYGGILVQRSAEDLS